MTAVIWESFDGNIWLQHNFLRFYMRRGRLWLVKSVRGEKKCINHIYCLLWTTSRTTFYPLFKLSAILDSESFDAFLPKIIFPLIRNGYWNINIIPHMGFRMHQGMFFYRKQLFLTLAFHLLQITRAWICQICITLPGKNLILWVEKGTMPFFLFSDFLISRLSLW